MVAQVEASSNNSDLSAKVKSYHKETLNAMMLNDINFDKGLIVLARVRPSPEENFAQILMPTAALNYDTFRVKLCVALAVDVQSVKKVVKLPDVLIRSTEDVLRLRSQDKVEVRVHRVNPWLAAARVGARRVNAGGAVRTAAWTLFFGVIAVAMLRQQQILGDMARQQVTNEAILLTLTELVLPSSPHRPRSSAADGAQQRPSTDGSSAALSVELRRISDRLKAIERGCEGDRGDEQRRRLEQLLTKRFEQYERSLQTQSERLNEVAKIAASLKTALFG